MLSALRSQNHPLFRHGVIAVVLVSWLVLLISATCAMPAAWRMAPPSVSQCVDGGHYAPDSNGKHSPNQDCSFKPCLASSTSPGLAFAPPALELPVPVLCLLWLMGLGPGARPLRLPRAADPPPGRRIPLFYQFCALLN